MELSSQAQSLKPGLYRHFKGGEYKVLGVARHSETLEELVLYEHLDDASRWVRPLPMFLEEVDKDGYKGPRFKHVEE